MIRIMVVHPESSTADTYVEHMRGEDDLRVIYRTPSAREALAHIGNDNCDVVVASTALADNGAMQLTHAIRDNHPAIKVVIVNLPEEENLVLQFVAAGAASYTSCGASVEQVMAAIRLAVNRKARVSPRITAALMQRLVELRQISLPNSSNLNSLTRRQREVLGLIARGLTNADIAERLVLEVGTVKNHVHRILKKLNLHSRRDAATLYATLKAGGDSSFNRFVSRR